MTPTIVAAGEPSEDKLERIVKRGGDEVNVQNLKKDPEFNSFLDGVLKRRKALESRSVNNRY